MFIDIGDVVRITGETHTPHYFREGVLCRVVDLGAVAGDDVVLEPVEPGDHNWIDGDDLVQNWVSPEDVEVVVSVVSDWRSLEEIEAFLSDRSPTPNGGNRT